METSTINVNHTLNKISSAIATAKRKGYIINTSFTGDYFYCASTEGNLNSRINLNDTNAHLKLKALLQNIYLTNATNKVEQSAY